MHLFLFILIIALTILLFLSIMHSFKYLQKKEENNNTQNITLSEEENLPFIYENIINYVQEENLIKAYFNQKALDEYLYYRAKTKSNNFTSKNKFEDEKYKKNITIKDISINRHNIVFYPFKSNDYIQEDNVCIVLGLYYLDFSNYCNKNNISLFETGLYTGIPFYSKYKGNITYCIEDKYYRGINLGNEIKDGDLLFSINLTNPKNNINNNINILNFNYGLLDKDFINTIPYLSDIMVYKCLVDDFSIVSKDDDLFLITEYYPDCHRWKDEPKYKTIIKSPFSGIIKINDKLNQNLKIHFYKKIEFTKQLCIIYSTKYDLEKDYPEINNNVQV